MRCCVLQHLDFEDLGTLAPVLREAGWTIQTCHVADGLPDARDWRDADLCIVLGGPMGVHDGAAYPFLVRELELVRSRLGEGRPLLGICLGCQILLEHSEENDVRTLGIVPGRCVRFPHHMKEEDGSPAPVPHMGWNSLQLTEKGKKHPLFKYSKEGDYVYFVHSFYGKDCDESLLATSEYGIPVTASAANENVMGCQFHPEKSSDAGARLLANFATIARAARAGSAHADKVAENPVASKE